MSDEVERYAIHTPEGWVGAHNPPIASMPMEKLGENGSKVLLVSFLLRDGTNLVSLIYPDGQWHFRLAAENNWVPEECESGEAEPAVADLVEQTRQSVRDMYADIGIGGGPHG